MGGRVDRLHGKIPDQRETTSMDRGWNFFMKNAKHDPLTARPFKDSVTKKGEKRKKRRCEIGDVAACRRRRRLRMKSF